MRAVDTNVLVRTAVVDDARMAERARSLLGSGQDIYVSTIVLCELAWVLRSRYRWGPDRIATAIRALVSARQIVMDRDSVGAGLDFLDRGGDFADGVILHDARRAGAVDVSTFDQDFARLGAPDVDLLS